jgi:Bacterial Ig domain
MKSASLAVTGLGLVTALMTGCVETPDLGSNQGMSFAAWKATLYREPTGLYVLDGDTVVRSDERLFEIWSGAQPGQLAVYTQAGQDVKWTATQRVQLTYCISNSFGANKATVVTALAGGSDAGWEMMADVDFIYVPAQDANCTAGNTAVLFDVNPVNAQGQYLARSFFPDSPRGDRNILIDASAFDPGLTWPLRNILAHEMGHILGFRHEHTRPEAGGGCFEDNDYRALTPYDSASVMHYPQCNGTSADLAFTNLDRQGVAALYGVAAPNPMPMAQFNAPANGATVPPTFAIDTQVVDSDLDRVELWLDGAMVDSKTAGPFVFTVTDHAEGPLAIEIRAFDQRAQMTSQSITVTVRIGTTGGGGIGDGDGDGNADTITGGCAAGGSEHGPLTVVGLGLGLVAALRRRRR